MVQRQCLDEDILTSYLEGLLDAPVRTATEQHLVGCDECRSRLVLYMRILDEDVLEEEDSVVQAAMARWGNHKESVVVDPQHRSLSAKWLAIAAMMLIAHPTRWRGAGSLRADARALDGETPPALPQLPGLEHAPPPPGRQPRPVPAPALRSPHLGQAPARHPHHRLHPAGRAGVFEVAGVMGG